MKKNSILLSAFLVLVASFGIIPAQTYAAPTNTQVTFALTPGEVTIGAPATLAFTNTLTASFDEQTLTQDFAGEANYFWVSDLKWSREGYSTTLSLSGDLTDPDGGVLSGSTLQFKTLGVLALMAGKNEPNVVIPTDSGTYKSLGTAQTLINRPTGNKKPQLGQYGIALGLQIVIPAGQAWGSYAGTLVYTLTEL